MGMEATRDRVGGAKQYSVGSKMVVILRLFINEQYRDSEELT